MAACRTTQRYRNNAKSAVVGCEIPCCCLLCLPAASSRILSGVLEANIVADTYFKCAEIWWGCSPLSKRKFLRIFKAVVICCAPITKGRSPKRKICIIYCDKAVKIYGGGAVNDAKMVHLGCDTCHVFKNHLNPLDRIPMRQAIHIFLHQPIVYRTALAVFAVDVPRNVFHADLNSCLQNPPVEVGSEGLVHLDFWIQTSGVAPTLFLRRDTVLRSSCLPQPVSLWPHHSHHVDVTLVVLVPVLSVLP